MGYSIKNAVARTSENDVKVWIANNITEKDAEVKLTYEFVDVTDANWFKNMLTEFKLSVEKAQEIVGKSTVLSEAQRDTVIASLDESFNRISMCDKASQNEVIRAGSGLPFAEKTVAVSADAKIVQSDE